MTEAERSAVEGRGLLLFDGVCGLCHGVVRFLVRRDRAARLRFAPLESGLGQEVLERVGLAGFRDGVVLVTGALTAAERVFVRSDAVAQAVELLGGGWRLLGWTLRLVPKALREFGYGVVARIRYRVFGRFSVCPLPGPGERGRLLGIGGQ